MTHSVQILIGNDRFGQCDSDTTGNVSGSLTYCREFAQTLGSVSPWMWPALWPVRAQENRMGNLRKLAQQTCKTMFQGLLSDDMRNGIFFFSTNIISVGRRVLGTSRWSSKHNQVVHQGDIHLALSVNTLAAHKI